MLLLCTGTRFATIADHGLTVLHAILDVVPADAPGQPHQVYVGDADGVDLIIRTLLGKLATWRVHEFEAEWDQCAADCDPAHRRRYVHGRGDHCPLAGRRRNVRMVTEYASASGRLVLPFPAANARSSGTRGCVAEAKRAGLDIAAAVPLVVAK